MLQLLVLALADSAPGAVDSEPRRNVFEISNSLNALLSRGPVIAGRPPMPFNRRSRSRGRRPVAPIVNTSDQVKDSDSRPNAIVIQSHTTPLTHLTTNRPRPPARRLPTRRSVPRRQKQANSEPESGMEKVAVQSSGVATIEASGSAEHEVASLSSSPSLQEQLCAQPAVCVTLAEEPDGMACCLDADPSKVVAVFGHEKAALRAVPSAKCPTACTFELEARLDTVLEDAKLLDVKLRTDSKSSELFAPGVREHSTLKSSTSSSQRQSFEGGDSDPAPSVHINDEDASLSPRLPQQVRTPVVHPHGRRDAVRAVSMDSFNGSFGSPVENEVSRHSSRVSPTAFEDTVVPASVIVPPASSDRLASSRPRTLPQTPELRRGEHRTPTRRDVVRNDGGQARSRVPPPPAHEEIIVLTTNEVAASEPKKTEESLACIGLATFFLLVW